MQQGQVDWVAFGNTVWSAAAATLQRFASSGIHAVTYGAGLALASQFRISDLGRRRMDQVMQSLRGVPGLDKVLWFGFGHQSFVKIMGENQHGLKCLALCSCLAEVHSEEPAAWVLGALWDLYEFPETYEPSHSQFLILAKACSSVIARSSFNEALDAMTGHGRWMFDRKRIYNPVLKASNARHIAKAMEGLFKITTGEVEAIKLLGQNECAVVAAFGYWLFDLAVYIQDDEGNALYRSHESLTSEGAQVLVHYTLEDQPSALQRRTTYVLPVGTDVISKFVSSSESRWIWKIPWDGRLARTFNPVFQDLSSLAYTFGAFLGSTARIYAALASGEPNVSAFSRVRFIESTQFSHGKGFINSVISIFPELERIRGLYDSMERALNSSFDIALQGVEQAAQSLRNTCYCDLCSGRSSPDSNPSFSNGAPSGKCLFSLAMTIRNLVAILACTNRDEALLVAVYGLQS